MSKAIEFAIVGAGWRADFYLRIAHALPERFRVVGVAESDQAKRTAFGAKWAVPVFAGLAELLKKTSPTFVAAAVSWPSTPVVLAELSDAGMPALSETPPAPDVAGLRALGSLVRKKPKI